MHIGFLLCPGLTQLDLTGPAQLLHRLPGARVHYVAASLTPVMSDCGLALVPTVTFADCPTLDIVCVPGGFACVDVMVDPPTLSWLRGQAAGARYVTSVCTGSLILAAAGLLTGYRAACHWAWGDQLAAFEADWVAERVVIDRDRVTGGGVTAGIDFGFALIAKIAGRDVADTLRLALEYDPQARSGGTPATARPEILAAANAAMAARLTASRAKIAVVAATFDARRAAA